MESVWQVTLLTDIDIMSQKKIFKIYKKIKTSKFMRNKKSDINELNDEAYFCVILVLIINCYYRVGDWLYKIGSLQWEQ